MIDGEQLGNVGFKYLGVPYSEMDCQAFVEKCIADCGIRKDLAGSNAWYREIMNHGAVKTPEECIKELGKVPTGAFLFILKQDGGEPAKYRQDGIGNASHIGICTGSRGEGAIHSSSSKGCVCESKFKGKTIPNGGWNRVGLWDQVAYDYGAGPPGESDDHSVWRPTLRRGSRGTDVAYVQAVLMSLGYDLEPYGADGDFGRKTEEAVMQFQRDHGLIADGVVGPMTYDAMEQAEEKPTVLYTVTIPHCTKQLAEEMRKQYQGVEIRKE